MTDKTVPHRTEKLYTCEIGGLDYKFFIPAAAAPGASSFKDSLRLFIVPHLGLGDQIICNGLVREIRNLVGPVAVICYLRQLELISYMYRDDPGILVLATLNPRDSISARTSDIPVPSDSWSPLTFSPPNICLGLSYIEFMRNRFTSGESELTFDEVFYEQVGIDFEKRFSKFYFQRDHEREDEVFKSLVNPGEEYIFVHDDPARGMNINPEYLPDNFKIIRNDKSINPFHYGKLFENATELHLMQSGIHELCNSMSLDKPEIYIHEYIRKYSSFLVSKARPPDTRQFVMDGGVVR